jgi:hypothetical protein
VIELFYASQFFATARERYAIKLRRDLGEKPPWSKDPAYQDWRFCNVHREDDRTTRWFADNVRTHVSGIRAIEATIIFRWFNRIETGELIKDLLLDGWNRAEAERRLKDVHPLVTGAYMIKTLTGFNKLDGILESIEVARRMLPGMVDSWGESLQAAWTGMRNIPYLGPFMSYEVISDLRWTPVLRGASDIMTWANAGPGCTHGIGRVISGNPKMYNRGSAAHQELMLEAMRFLLVMSVNNDFWPHSWRQWEMREVEHWACEYDKYVRATQGERMKRRFDW